MNFVSPMRVKQTWVAAVIFAVLLINYPVLTIFDKAVLIFGIPLLFWFFMLGWVGSISVICLYLWILNRSEKVGSD